MAVTSGGGYERDGDVIEALKRQRELGETAGKLFRKIERGDPICEEDFDDALWTNRSFQKLVVDRIRKDTAVASALRVVGAAFNGKT